MDVFTQTIRKEGFVALYKGISHHITQLTRTSPRFNTGMASPLLGIPGVNSLLLASYGISKRIISLYPLSLKEMAVVGAANAILASPGSPPENLVTPRC